MSSQERSCCTDPACQCCGDAVGLFCAFASFLDVNSPIQSRSGAEVKADIRECIESLAGQWYGEKWAQFRAMTAGKSQEELKSMLESTPELPPPTATPAPE